MKAKNDNLIEQFINDLKYFIFDTGVILNSKKTLGFTKKTEAKLRKKQYMYIGYKGKELKVHRIIYRKFLGLLDNKLVVHHKDGNALNNHISNLELTTQEINSIHR